MSNYAIDLGTTNTTVSMATETIDGGLKTIQLKIQQLDGNKSPMAGEILPSAIYMDDNNKIYTGRIAKELREVRGNRVISNYKRYMGKDYLMKISKREFSAKELSKEILMSCKRSMERYGYEKGEKITITVPASFDSDQIEDTVDAAKLAGFSGVNIIPEPTAALIDYIHEEVVLSKDNRNLDFGEKKRILVLDLGGGTYDISVIDITQVGKKVDFIELGVGRYDELGGVDFDLTVQKYLLKNFCNERKIEFKSLKEEEQVKMTNSLRIFAEKAKEYISANIDFGFEDEEFTQFIMNFHKGEDVEFSINRKKYDEITKSLYEYGKEILCYEDINKSKNIIDPILETLREYKINKNSIDLVFLTGGMSQYATVSEEIGRALNIDKGKMIKSPYPLEAVSRGASLYQYYDTHITKKNNEDEIPMESEVENIDNLELVDTNIEITKVMAEAVMVDIVEGLPVTIIDRNQKVPYTGSINGLLRTTSPAGISVNLYSGRDPFDWQIKLQKSKKALFKNPIKIGTPIDINFEIDENKYLTMSIKVGKEIIELNDKLSESVIEDLRG